MIYNKEYAQRIKANHDMPPSKWIVRTPLFPDPVYCSDWYKKWCDSIRIKPPTPRKFVCIVCGCSGTFWYDTDRPDLCPDCEMWADGYGKRNKEQINLFQIKESK